MGKSVLAAVAAGLANVLAVLAVAPFLQGVLRKVTARIQSRRGPPLRQPYYDLLKLLGKEDLESGEWPVLQRAAAYLALGTVLTVACLVPMGFGPPAAGAGDAVLLVYLLTLAGACTLFAGLAAGSTFSLVGVSREMILMVALEPLLALAVLAGAVHVRSFRLERVLAGSVYASAVPISGALLLAVMVLSFQAFVGRAPFDISEAETELMEGPMVEYSGRKLALFKYAHMCKLVVYGGLAIALFAPWGARLPLPLALLAFWAKVAVLVLLVTVVAATHARYRIDQALGYFGGLVAVSLVALALASHGW